MPRLVLRGKLTEVGSRGGGVCALLLPGDGGDSSDHRRQRGWPERGRGKPPITEYMGCGSCSALYCCVSPCDPRPSLGLCAAFIQRQDER